MASDFMKFHTSVAAGLKSGQFNRKRNFHLPISKTLNRKIRFARLKTLIVFD
jgi:hypothetical protein